MWATPDSETASAASRELGAQVVALTEKYPEVPTVTEVVRGDPQRLLDAMSEHQAMIVVGAHHPELAGRLPLSVTTSVLEHAQCPVAVVPVES
jgi:nucleotide-binding universal stress UspA family protein